MFLLIISIILIIMIITYCLNNNIVEGYDVTQDCIGKYEPQYGVCSKQCGGGTQKLLFNMKIEPKPGYFRGNKKEPVPCPPNLTRECNTHNCPIDCKYVGGGEGWGNWIKNLDSNGKQLGTETRTREISIPDNYGGIPCGKETETKDYVVDCGYSGWSSWGACSNTCGDGTQRRTRSILQQPKNGGNPCGELEQTKNCNIKPCPVDCVLSDWKNRSYYGCSKTCGGGMRMQTNDILQQPKHEGQSCGARSRYVDCNTQRCPPPPPIDCVGKWEWTGGCNRSKHKKKYRITRNSANAGDQCLFTDGQVLESNVCTKKCADHNWYGDCKRYVWRRLK